MLNLENIFSRQLSLPPSVSLSLPPSLSLLLSLSLSLFLDEESDSTCLSVDNVGRIGRTCGPCQRIAMRLFNRVHGLMGFKDAVDFILCVFSTSSFPICTARHDRSVQCPAFVIVQQPYQGARISR